MNQPSLQKRSEDELYLVRLDRFLVALIQFYRISLSLRSISELSRAASSVFFFFFFFWGGGGCVFIRGWALINFSYLQGG